RVKKQCAMLGSAIEPEGGNSSVRVAADQGDCDRGRILRAVCRHMSYHWLSVGHDANAPPFALVAYGRSDGPGPLPLRPSSGLSATQMWVMHLIVRTGFGLAQSPNGDCIARDIEVF